jgi:hypothetical protein
MVDSFHDEFVAKQAADKRAQQFDRRMMLNSPELLDITE